MHFLRECKTAVLALVLILGFLPILGAQAPSLPEDPAEIMPQSRDLHFPESSISKATAGTLSGDADAFMSTIDWGSIENMESTFILAGVDEWGLALGFGRKLGKAYLGASYSGDLIDELYRRVTNKETDSLWKTETKTSTPGNPTSFDTFLRNENGVTPPGLTISNNDINLIFGVGIFGIRLGFAEWIRSVDYADSDNWVFENSLESSLKPNLEIGFNIGLGKVTIKPAIWAAFDIHEFKTQRGSLYNDLSGGMLTTYWTIYDSQVNFWEPSAGLGLGVEVALSDSFSMEFGLEGEGALRMYREPGDSDPLTGSLTYAVTSGTAGLPRLPLIQNASNQYLDNTGAAITGSYTTTNFGDVTVPFDLRISGAPSFSISGDISERLTIAGKLAVDGEFLLQDVEVENPGSKVAVNMMTIYASPDLALGASFHLIPDHFSLHAGLGIQLFSFTRTVSKSETTPTGGTAVTGPEITNTDFGLPHVRFGGGLTINLTQAVALDAMAFSSGLDFDSTLFNLLLTVKK